jgi:NAD(P)-dependent dehydrogenase (short-subunit alcohol dehydrogenase family)
MELRGKKALVTGTSSGVGAATLGDRAAAVHAVDLTGADGLRRLALRLARRRRVYRGPLGAAYFQHALFPRLVQWLMIRTGYRRLRP